MMSAINRTQRKHQIGGALVILMVLAAPLRAEVIEFRDKDEWIAAVGDYTTIDFTGFDEGTKITDQCADLGILFTDGYDFIDFGQSYLNDGVGLYGGYYEDIDVAFDAWQAWIAVGYPGSVQFDFYCGEELIHSSPFYTTGAGNFAGVVSSVLFDKVVLSGPIGGSVSIDDLYFGVPAPSALAMFVLFSASVGWRYRR
jgi:hypothetical protein